MTTRKRFTRHDQVRATQFLLRLGPNKWHGYYPNKTTVELICSLVNLGIAEVNQFDQFKLRGSGIHARQFINARS